MKRVRKYLSMLLVGIVTLSLTGCIVQRTEESKSKTVLAKVGDKKITRGDLDKFMYYYLNQYEQSYGEDFEENEDLKDTLKEQRTSALETLVQQEVLLQKQDEIGAVCTDEEIKDMVDEQISSIIESYPDDEFVEYIATYGYTEKEFEEYLTVQAKLTKILDKMLEDVTVSDDEIKEYYDENVSSYVLEPGAYVKHILFTDETTGEVDAKAARELVLQGKTFEEIAEMDEYKDKCQTSDLGHQVFEDNANLVTEFVDGFKNLPEGEVSEPVKTSYGWHLIINTKVNKEEVTQTLDEVKDSISNTLLNEKKSSEFDSRIEKLEKEMEVKIYTDRF